MILTGVDTNHEDLIEWWLNNALKHNPNENIGVWDFGMSPAKREKIEKDYSKLKENIRESFDA